MWLQGNILIGYRMAQHGKLAMPQWGHYTVTMKKPILFGAEESRLQGLANVVNQDPELQEHITEGRIDN